MISSGPCAKQVIDPRLLVALAALVVATGVIALIAVGGKAGTTTKQPQAQNAEFEAAGLLTPVTAAPPLKLRNYLGQQVNLNSYKGKAVLVTFIYTHCPDVCPLITSNLRIAQNLMGANLSKSEVVAVSVDPKGDTAPAISAFLARHQMTGRMQYLVGTPKELAAVVESVGGRLRTRREQAGIRQPQRPDLRHHSLRQAPDDLRIEFQAERNRARRAAARSPLREAVSRRVIGWTVLALAVIAPRRVRARIQEIDARRPHGAGASTRSTRGCADHPEPADRRGGGQAGRRAVLGELVRAVRKRGSRSREVRHQQRRESAG